MMRRLEGIDASPGRSIKNDSGLQTMMRRLELEEGGREWEGGQDGRREGGMRKGGGGSP